VVWRFSAGNLTKRVQSGGIAVQQVCNVKNLVVTKNLVVCVSASQRSTQISPETGCPVGGEGRSEREGGRWQVAEGVETKVTSAAERPTCGVFLPRGVEWV